MDYKNDIKKHFENADDILEYRYNTSKSIFIYSTLFFFLNYFFVWAKFFDNIFLLTLPFAYIWFLMGIFTFIYFYISYTFKPNKTLNIISGIILFILFLVFLLPFSWISIN